MEILKNIGDVAEQLKQLDEEYIEKHTNFEAHPFPLLLIVEKG